MNVVYNNVDAITNPAILTRLNAKRDKFELIGVDSDPEMRMFLKLDDDANCVVESPKGWIGPIPEAFTDPEFNDGGDPAMWTCCANDEWSYVAFTVDGSEEVHHVFFTTVWEAFGEFDDDPNSLDWTKREDRWVFMLTE